MHKFKLFSRKQFGFITQWSTVLQLLQVWDWTGGGSIGTAYTDFMKAFNKVPHGRLLKKLESYGINGHLRMTQMFREIIGATDLETFQKDINELYGWSQKWLLHFHPDKYKIMFIGKPTEELYMPNLRDPIKQVTEEKDLEVIIDNKLIFRNEITQRVNKAYRIMWTIRLPFHHLQRPVKQVQGPGHNVSCGAPALVLHENMRNMCLNYLQVRPR